LNYLAHAYLSFHHPQVLVGNMISDYVKGKKQYDYSRQIQAGIRLHRAIDNFTDSHICIKEAKKIFKDELGTYSGAFIDIVLDYYLANDKTKFKTEKELHLFALNCYDVLENNTSIFPEKFARLFRYMKTQNWLYHYKDDYGIQQSFRGLTNRAQYINKNHHGFQAFLHNKKELKVMYDVFIEDVQQYAWQQFQDSLIS
jgi:acyl carrier protein phosphodiesterase